MRGKRGAFQRQLKQVPVEKRVFVDECGTTTGMTRLYARAPCGQRVHEAVPQGNWKVKTVAGAMRCDGVTAALAFDGPTDAVAFVTFAKEVLGPTLRPGDVVILDNLRPHKDSAVRDAIEARGARLLYLSPYSPDYSPIEPMWSKFKEHLRSVGARTDPELIHAMGDALRSINASDTLGYFEHCGYVVH